MENQVDYTMLPQKEKYMYLLSVLEKIETNLLYKGEVIEGNQELEIQRTEDTIKLKKTITDELNRDNLTKMFIRGKLIHKNGQW